MLSANKYFSFMSLYRLLSFYNIVVMKPVFDYIVKFSAIDRHKEAFNKPSDDLRFVDS